MMQVKAIYQNTLVQATVLNADRIDEITTPGYIYLGFQFTGAAENAAEWLIMRVDISTAGITKREWANGSNAYNQKWSERATVISYADKNFR